MRWGDQKTLLVIVVIVLKYFILYEHTKLFTGLAHINIIPNIISKKRSYILYKISNQIYHHIISYCIFQQMVRYSINYKIFINTVPLVLLLDDKTKSEAQMADLHSGFADMGSTMLEVKLPFATAMK